MSSITWKNVERIILDQGDKDPRNGYHSQPLNSLKMNDCKPDLSSNCSESSLDTSQKHDAPPMKFDFPQPGPQSKSVEVQGDSPTNTEESQQNIPLYDSHNGSSCHKNSKHKEQHNRTLYESHMSAQDESQLRLSMNDYESQQGHSSKSNETQPNSSSKLDEHLLCSSSKHGIVKVDLKCPTDTNLTTMCTGIEVFNATVQVLAQKWEETYLQVLAVHPMKNRMDFRMSVSPIRVVAFCENLIKCLPQLRDSLKYTAEKFQWKKRRIMWYHQNIYAICPLLQKDFSRFRYEIPENEVITSEVAELAKDLDDTCLSIRGVSMNLKQLMEKLGKLSIPEEHFLGEESENGDQDRSLVTVNVGRSIRVISRREWWRWKAFCSWWWKSLDKKWVIYGVIPGLMITGTIGIVTVLVLHKEGYFTRENDNDATLFQLFPETLNASTYDSQ